MRLAVCLGIVDLYIFFTRLGQNTAELLRLCTIPAPQITCNSAVMVCFNFIQLEKVLHRGLTFRHCSPQTVGTLRNGQQKLTTFWRGIPPEATKKNGNIYG